MHPETRAAHRAAAAAARRHVLEDLVTRLRAVYGDALDAPRYSSLAADPDDRGLPTGQFGVGLPLGSGAAAVAFVEVGQWDDGPRVYAKTGRWTGGCRTHRQPKDGPFDHVALFEDVRGRLDYQVEYAARQQEDRARGAAVWDALVAAGLVAGSPPANLSGVDIEVPGGTVRVFANGGATATLTALGVDGVMALVRRLRPPPEPAPAPGTPSQAGESRPDA
jgi:hypothetical protein